MLFCLMPVHMFLILELRLLAENGDGAALVGDEMRKMLTIRR